MVGRSLGQAEPRSFVRTETAGLVVRELTLRDRSRPGRRLLDAVSLSASGGEIVGIAGLAGSGASELLHALFGSYGRPDVAEIELAERRFVPQSARASLAQGVVLLANDRRLSLIGDLGIVENATLSSVRRWSRFAWIQRNSELVAARDVLGRLAAATSSAERELRRPVRRLSGGNQQKVALARCLLAKPRVLLLDEPTRGIDVAAKVDVYALVRSLAERGLVVLLVASEMEELLALADRIVVLHRGRVCDELTHGEFSRERILRSAMGGSVL
jgi:ABC-type sugar transport system ATPase subunit